MSRNPKETQRADLEEKADSDTDCNEPRTESEEKLIRETNTMKLNYLVEITCNTSELDEVRVVNVECYDLNEPTEKMPPKKTNTVSATATTSHSSGSLGDISKTDSNVSEPITCSFPISSISLPSASTSSSSTTTNPSLDTFSDVKVELIDVHARIKRRFMKQLHKTVSKSIKNLPPFINIFHHTTDSETDDLSSIPKSQEDKEGSGTGTGTKRTLLHRQHLFAFIDGAYYNAVILKRANDYTLRLRFYDGLEKTLKMTDVLVFDDSSLIGHHANFIYEGTIKTGTIKYLFVTDGVEFCTMNTITQGEITIQMSMISFDIPQMEIVQSSRPTVRIAGSPTDTNASKSPESERKRPRLTIDLSRPSTSGLSRPKNNNPEPVLVSTDDENDESDKSSSSTKTIDDSFIEGCDIETDFQEFRPTKNKSSLGGDIGKANVIGTWFKGLKFILTCGKRFITFEGYDSVSTDNEDYVFSKKPFIREHLHRLIEDGGGEIFFSFSRIPRNSYGHTYLITDRPGTTPTFLLCMRAGIKIISHEWVYNCTLKQRLVPLQELPRGWSLEKQAFILNDKVSGTPLTGIKIKIVNDIGSPFYRYWSKICRDAGAHVISIQEDKEVPPLLPHDKHKFILAPVESINPRIKEAYSMGYLIMTSRWIIQTLITGKTCDFYGSPSYNYFNDQY